MEELITSPAPPFIAASSEATRAAAADSAAEAASDSATASGNHGVVVDVAAWGSSEASVDKAPAP